MNKLTKKIFYTNILSPTSKVGSIEDEGIKNKTNRPIKIAINVFNNVLILS